MIFTACCILILFTFLLNLTESQSYPIKRLNELQISLDLDIKQDLSQDQTKSSYGFFIDVPILNSKDDTSEIQSIPMMLALYTARTTIVTGCNLFNSYCQIRTCLRETQDQTSLDHLYFKAQGIKLVEPLFNANWINTKDAILAEKCIYSEHSFDNTGTYGIIGLDFSKVFGIYLEKDRSRGELLYFDKFPVEGLEPSISLQARANLKVFGLSHIKIGGEEIKMSSPPQFIALDLNTEVTGLPKELYELLIMHLNQKVPTMKCYDKDYYKPKCAYTGVLEDLPNITLQIQGKDFDIPREVYVGESFFQNDMLKSVTLNIKAISDTLKGQNYVSNEFTKCVIIGSDIIASYYIIFGREGQSANFFNFYPRTSYLMHKVSSSNEEKKDDEIYKMNEEKHETNMKQEDTDKSDDKKVHPDINDQELPNNNLNTVSAIAATSVIVGLSIAILNKKRSLAKKELIIPDVEAKTKVEDQSEINQEIIGKSEELNEFSNVANWFDNPFKKENVTNKNSLLWNMRRDSDEHDCNDDDADINEAAENPKDYRIIQDRDSSIDSDHSSHNSSDENPEEIKGRKNEYQTLVEENDEYIRNKDFHNYTHD